VGHVIRSDPRYVPGAIKLSKATVGEFLERGIIVRQRRDVIGELAESIG
jgi:hypothetical protein